jgi:hypothetical protein
MMAPKVGQAWQDDYCIILFLEMLKSSNFVFFFIQKTIFFVKENNNDEYLEN